MAYLPTDVPVFLEYGHSPVGSTARSGCAQMTV
jgi:hypothetical protein